MFITAVGVLFFGYDTLWCCKVIDIAHWRDRHYYFVDLFRLVYHHDVLEQYDEVRGQVFKNEQSKASLRRVKQSRVLGLESEIKMKERETKPITRIYLSRRVFIRWYDLSWSVLNARCILASLDLSCAEADLPASCVAMKANWG